MSHIYDSTSDDYSSRHHRRRDDDSPPPRSRPRRSPTPAAMPRDVSPDFHSGGSIPYASGALPVRSASPYGQQQHTPFYAPPPATGGDTLRVPRDRDSRRPRSVPPPDSALLVPHRGRRDSYSNSSVDEDHDDEKDRDRRRANSPMSKARHVLQTTFSQSTSGLGVGVLGAVIGGLAAREASEKARQSQQGHHGRGGGSSSSHSKKDDHAALISTILGAAVGGLGANAIEKRVEKSRKKTKGEQVDWEKRWGRDGKDGPRGGERGLGGGGGGGDRDRDRDRGLDARDRERERERRGSTRDRDAVAGSGHRSGGTADDYYATATAANNPSDDDYVYDARRERRRSDEGRRRY
ncbi:hypothetical protein B0H63DRAFT_164409 [Podospora didyma]|uniref:Uncharacterized protein n=1 Tax=Podospora didyma TaxID=330526 RepID=A0AAE0NU66_9PEZI|nr:hypothetical protein B0H63DRAFT_164409 [Podospora didyma]